MSDGTVIPFGKYELLESLGEGGMASVYRARYLVAPGVSKPVVIKRVLREYADDPVFVEMFIHEARITVGLSHANLVQVFDFGQVEGEYFLAMELVDGLTLSRVLKKAHAVGLPWLPPPLAVHIASELCKGLHHAHTRTDEKKRPLGLVHRDVSPDNVLISYEGEVKLADFGVAKVRLAGGPETQAGVVKGKYHYFSPEQARGIPDLDARSDVYAVGVLLFLMLCGRLPMEGDEDEMIQRIIQGQLLHPRALNPELDDDLVQILQEALATRGELRTPSAEALHEKLARWAATRAQHHPAITAKELVGLLYEAELTAMGRPPRLRPKLVEEVATWSRAQKRPSPSSDDASSSSTRKATQDPGTGRTGPRVPRSAAQTGRSANRTGKKASKPGSGTPRAKLRPAGAAGSDLRVETDTQPQAPASAPKEPEATEEPYARLTGGLMKAGSYWFLLVAAVVLGVMGMKIADWVSPPIPPLVIRSEPPGAMVLIDKAYKGVTPLEVQGVSRKDAHEVEVSLPGRRPWSARYGPGMLGEELRVNLEPARGR